MPVWQRVVDHIGDQRILVESRGGNRYPVRTAKDRVNDEVYKWAMGDRPNDELWVWVGHGDGEPTAEWTSTGHPSGGPPDGPPGEG